MATLPDNHRVHRDAAVRFPARSAPPAAPVTVTRLTPEGMAAVRGLAGGDMARVVFTGPAAAVVYNTPQAARRARREARWQARLARHEALPDPVHHGDVFSRIEASRGWW